MVGFFETDGADVMAAAGFTETSFPKGIKMLEDGVDDCRSVGPDADLEISFAVGLCPQAGAGEIGAAQVKSLAIDYDRLGMQAWASADGYTVG